MRKTTLIVTAAVLAAGFTSVVHAAALPAQHENPVDEISNPNHADFSDEEIHPENLDHPFVRTGPITDPKQLSAITAGTEQAQVLTLLGEPVNKKGRAWDYNFTFTLPQSGNFIVCQYKVQFDRDERVSKTVWRRQQCQELAA